MTPTKRLFNTFHVHAEARLYPRLNTFVLCRHSLRHKPSLETSEHRYIFRRQLFLQVWRTMTRILEAGELSTIVPHISETTQSSTIDPPETPKEPQRVYETYSWRDKAPDTRLAYIRDLATAELELSKLTPGPLGFDLEWKPNRWKGSNNPVALVQLASHDTILLIQVTAMLGIHSVFLIRCNYLTAIFCALQSFHPT